MKRLAVIGALVCAHGALATDIALIRDELRIPRGKTHALEFGTVPQRDTTALLEIESRLDSERLAGSMFFLDLTLNGRHVKAARSRSAVRLVNRPLVSPVAANTPSAWYGAQGWRVLYAPDFKGALAHTYYAGNPYRLVLDITDLTNPAAENRLEITNTFPNRHTKYAGTPGDLIIRKLMLRTTPTPSPMMADANTAKPHVNTGQPAAGPAPYKAEIAVGGGIRVTVGPRQWLIDSAFSYPNAGLNHLVADPAANASSHPDWHVAAEMAEGGAIVQATGPHYRLQRTVRFTPRRIDVADALTNIDPQAPLGMMVRHTVDLDNAAEATVRLAGNPDPAIDAYYSPPNPSVHIALPDQGLGLICEDDVFRNQARLFCADQGKTAGLRTNMLRLGPGETYTMHWAIYPVAGPDYYDFINLVRQDWGANVTVLGPWTFFNPDTIIATPIEDIRANFTRLGIRYAVYCGGWVDRKHDAKRIGFGTGVMDDYWTSFRSRLKDAAELIRKAVPDCQVLIYYDTQRDTSEGGHERFKDSWLTNREGDQLSTEWSGRYSLTRSVVAALENTFGKAMLRVADRYLDDLNADGLYWDEMENVAYGVPLITHNQQDGHTCILDPETYTIQREVGLTTLLGESHRLAVIERTRKRGGFLMGNGPPTTKDLLQTGVQRMTEIQHNDVWCHEGDLATPLGYASSRMDFGNWVRAIGMAKLLVGTRYTYEHEISKYVFPFTPLELHHGYLLGKERIITIHSGSYGWPDEQCLVQVHHFDAKGIRTGQGFPTTFSPAEARTHVQLPEGEAAILERLPLELSVQQGKATVSDVTLSDVTLSLTVEAPAGATLTIPRKAAVLSGPCTLRVGTSAPRAISPASRTLTIPLPPRFNGAIVLRKSHRLP